MTPTGTHPIILDRRVIDILPNPLRVVIKLSCPFPFSKDGPDEEQKRFMDQYVGHTRRYLILEGFISNDLPTKVIVKTIHTTPNSGN